jgi:hypothetical protein
MSEQEQSKWTPEELEEYDEFITKQKIISAIEEQQDLDRSVAKISVIALMAVALLSLGGIACITYTSTQPSNIINRTIK